MPTHDLTQDIANGILTIQPARADAAVKKWSVGSDVERNKWKTAPALKLYARLPGQTDIFIGTIPTPATIGFWTHIGKEIAAVGLPPNKVKRVNLCLASQDHVNAHIVLANWVREIIFANNGKLKYLKKMEEMPVYRYLRIAQVAQALGDYPTRQEMLVRIDKLGYHGQIYKPDINDLQSILTHIPPNHRIRRQEITMMAQAFLDGRLQHEISRAIYNMMKENSDFEKEYCAAEAEEKNIRAVKKAQQEDPAEEPQKNKRKK